MNHPSRIAAIKNLSELLILIGLCLLGLVLFSAVGFVVIHFASGLSLEEIQNLALDPEAIPNSRTWLLILQSITALGSFIFLPSLLRFLKKPGLENGLAPVPLNFTLLALVGGLAVLMMPVNGWLAAWNESMHVPGFLQDFQQWAHEKEQELETLTLFLVDFQSPLEIALGFLVIAVVAGVSEEFFFRKMLQPRIIALSGNPHVGIWVTAFLFSAIHMQFFGLIPRMVLGALFGYYYFWSGRIVLPMLAHVLNNGLTLIGMLLYKRNLSPINVEDPHVIPWYFGAACAGICWSLSTMVMEEIGKIRVRSAQLADGGEGRPEEKSSYLK